MQSKKVSAILENKGFELLYNAKMHDFCNALGIDILNCDSYRNARRYGRYYQAVVKDDCQQGYVYRLRKKQFNPFYGDDTSLTEWSNSEMVFSEQLDSIKAGMGVAIWYAFSLAKTLMSLSESFTVALDYTDVDDKRYAFYGENDCPDMIRVSFYINRESCEDAFTNDFSRYDPAYCVMLIKYTKD